MDAKKLLLGGAACAVSLSASAVDVWVHDSRCASVALSSSLSQGLPGAKPNETVMNYAGANGWELAAIEPNGCELRAQNPRQRVYENRFWFKKKVDAVPATPLSLIPAPAR